MAETRIGISGWTYAPWRGTFFPKGLPQNKELAYAAEHVRSIEINGTFYSLQRPSSYATWHDETPAGFVFAVKGPRFITHIKRLNNVVAPLGNFFASGVLRLNDKLGPILWQLPPNTHFNPERLEQFFQLLPRSTREAAVFARHHDHRLKARAWMRAHADRPLRHALEVRHPSFETEEFIALLRRHNVALVVADTAGKWPLMMDVTSDFVYVRLHGDTELYASGYTREAIQLWAQRVAAWSRGGDAPDVRLIAGAAPNATARDVYVYFDNDVKTHAPYDAMALAHALGLSPPPPPRPSLDPPRPPETVRTSWIGWGTPPKRSRSVSRAANRN